MDASTQKNTNTKRYENCMYERALVGVCVFNCLSEKERRACVNRVIQIVYRVGTDEFIGTWYTHTNCLRITHTHIHWKKKANTNDRKVVFDNKAGFVERKTETMANLFLNSLTIFFLHHFSPLSLSFTPCFSNSILISHCVFLTLLSC